MIKALLLTLVLTHGADTATSLYGFSHGAVEVNPLIASTHPAPFLVQEATLTTVQVWAFARLHQHHPRLATGLTLACIGVETAVTTHNVRVLRASR